MCAPTARTRSEETRLSLRGVSCRCHQNQQSSSERRLPEDVGVTLKHAQGSARSPCNRVFRNSPDTSESKTNRELNSFPFFWHKLTLTTIFLTIMKKLKPLQSFYLPLQVSSHKIGFTRRFW